MHTRSIPILRWSGFWSFVAMGWLVTAGHGRVQAAESGSSSVQQLREELTRAQREIERLRLENAELRRALGTGTAPTAASTPVSPVAAAPAVPGTASVPATAATPAVPAQVITVPAPIEAGTLVEAEQLLTDYRTSEIAGDARYKGRRIQIRGKVLDFKKNFVGLGWTVRLQGADRLGLLRFQTSFPGISDFRPTPNQRLLEGRKPFAEWQVLLEQGQTLVLEGLCEGVNDGVIVFKDAKPVK